MTSTETGAAASTPDGAAPAVAEASTLAVEGLPVDSLRDAIPYLRRPFTPEAIRFKVQTAFKDAKGCLVVAYIDARLVIERLNLVVPDMWQAEYSPANDAPKFLWCMLHIDEHRGEPGYVTRSDIGESGKGFSKDVVSDALKRAAVHFGIGVSVYALPQITLWANQPHVEKKTSGGKSTLALTELGHTKLREGYGKWLVEHGSRLFGPALDHGDVEGATFDDGEGEPEGFTPEPPAALDDEKAKALRDELGTLYDQIRGIDATRIPPGKFNAWVSGTAHSHAQMEALRDHLKGVLDGMQGDST